MKVTGSTRNAFEYLNKPRFARLMLIIWVLLCNFSFYSFPKKNGMILQGILKSGHKIFGLVSHWDIGYFWPCKWILQSQKRYFVVSVVYTKLSLLFLSIWIDFNGLICEYEVIVWKGFSKLFTFLSVWLHLFMIRSLMWLLGDIHKLSCQDYGYFDLPLPCWQIYKYWYQVNTLTI